MQRHVWLIWLVAGGYLAYVFGSQGRWWVAAASVLVLWTLSARVSPWWSGRSATFADVANRNGRHGEGVVVYWRPGCPHCARLRRRLGPAGKGATWVNIWRDPEAAAYVRKVNKGDELVPTVIINRRALPNPNPTIVLNALQSDS